MPAKILTDKDADLKFFKGKTLAVLGFGSQGHAHALNLKESGCKVIIGLYPKSKSRAVAAAQGFEVFDTAEAVRLADVVMVAIPDTKQPAAYKADIDDVRESPSFELIELCKHHGAQVDYYDPLVPATWAGRKHDLKMTSVACDATTIASYDCVLISTAHSKVDYGVIAKNAKLCVDTRDALRAFEGEMGARLVRA